MHTAILPPITPKDPATAKFLACRKPPMLIGGELCAASTGLTLTSLDPATQESLYALPDASKDDVDCAVEAAHAAFDSWRDVEPSVRAHWLNRLAAEIESNAGMLAELETIDAGKLLGPTRHEIDAAAAILRYYAGLSFEIRGSTIHLSGSRRRDSLQASTYKEPLGVVAAITPWNAPFVVAVSKIAPALAAGCTVVLKPAELASASALWLASRLPALDFPRGVVNIVTGRGEYAGALLASHPHVAKISFTGSTAVGKQLATTAGAALRPLTLELGGKGPAIICADSPIERCADWLIGAMFGNAGQTCVAATRLYVHQSVCDDLFSALRSRAGRLVPGHGLNPAATLNALISREHADKVERYVRNALRSGARALFGGSR